MGEEWAKERLRMSCWVCESRAYAKKPWLVTHIATNGHPMLTESIAKWPPNAHQMEVHFVIQTMMIYLTTASLLASEAFGRTLSTAVSYLVSHQYPRRRRPRGGCFRRYPVCGTHPAATCSVRMPNRMSN